MKRKYNNARRQRLAEARALKKNLELVRKLEFESLDIELTDAELIHTLKQKLDRDNFKRNGGTRKDWRLKLRLRFLDRFVGKERMCPKCGRGPLPGTRQWIYEKGRKPFPVLCVSCHRSK